MYSSSAKHYLILSIKLNLGQLIKQNWNISTTPPDAQAAECRWQSFGIHLGLEKDRPEPLNTRSGVHTRIAEDEICRRFEDGLVEGRVYLYGSAARVANLKIEGWSLECKSEEKKLEVKYSKVKIVTVQKNVAK